jgi:hypothetical protein
VLWAVIIAAAGYGWFIYEKCAPYAGGSDSSGYLNSARLLAHGRLSEQVRTVPGLVPPAWSYYFYQPLGYAVDPQTGRMVPSYPIGLPIHYMIAAAVVGFEKAVRVVNALNALAAGALLYALGRQLGLARRWSLAGVALLWGCPVWIYQSLQPMSDNVATTWSLAAILCALRSHKRPAWAPAAGAALAVAVLVRPTSALLMLPVTVALGGRWRAWAGFALGALPGALCLGAYNVIVYGRIIATGYSQSGTNIFDAFGWEFLRGNLRHFAVWIPQLLSFPVAILAVVGLPALIRREPRVVLLLATWLAAFVGLYSCYFCAGETWWYLRFLLPALPAVILAALLALQLFSDRLPGKMAWLVPAAVLAVSLTTQVRLVRRLEVTGIRGGEHNYLLAATWLDEHLPAEAILLTMQLSGTVTYYNTQAIVRWDQITRDDFELLRHTAAALHRPIYAALFPFEQPRLQEQLGGEWISVGKAGNVTIWRLAGPATTEAPR